LTASEAAVKVTSGTMAILAIDLGEKRVGVAIRSDHASVVLPLTTLHRQSDPQVITELAELISRENVTRLVVGEPRRADGTRGDAAKRAASFARKLSRRTNLPCVLVDESLTSHEAERRLRDAGIDPRLDPARVDAVAAQILLEEAISSGALSQR
jgi:putative Holliday junction resolvase